MYNRPQLKDSLDIIRFICKEFWGDLFRKQVQLHGQGAVRCAPAWACQPGARRAGSTGRPWQQLTHRRAPANRPSTQVDNLRTNHRGTFVLSDREFRWLAKLSGGQAAGAASTAPPVELARDFLFLPCALLKGALAQLGLDCTVTADCSNFPAADFTVNVRPQ